MNLREFQHVVENNKYTKETGYSANGNPIIETKINIDNLVDELNEDGKLDIEMITEVWKRFQEYEREIQELQEEVEYLEEEVDDLKEKVGELSDELYAYED